MIVRVAVAAAVLALVGAGVLLAAGRDPRAPAPRPPDRPLITGDFHPSQSPATPLLRRGRLITAPGLFAFRATADDRHVVWVAGGVEEQDHPATVRAQDLTTRRIRTVARDVDPGLGLASTRNWVVYARAGPPARLLASSHDGATTVTLARALVAPLAGRGELVAWAEQAGGRLHVLVRDMARGTTWLAASLPKCEDGRCYRVDAVALADDGVVFTRVATAPDTSLVIRRAFTDRRLTQVRLDGDPQPDLAPSSAGAVYQALGRGWYRWDFGEARPRRVLRALGPERGVLAYERGRWLLQAQRGCSSVVLAREGRRTTTVATQRARHGLCAELGAATWTGRQLVTAWGLIPPESIEAHEDAGATGIVHAGAPLAARTAKGHGGPAR
jgi:hypothetical protein